MLIHIYFRSKLLILTIISVPVRQLDIYSLKERFLPARKRNGGIAR